MLTIDPKSAHDPKPYTLNRTDNGKLRSPAEDSSLVMT